MAKSFLVGNFLPAYSSSFRYKDDKHYRARQLDPELLQRRFAERAGRFRKRRRTYVNSLQLSLAAALLLLTGFFHVPFQGGETLNLTLAAQELVHIEEIAQTLQKTTPPPPPKPPIPIEVPDDEILEDDDLDLDATLDIDVPVIDLPPPPPVAQVSQQDDEPDFFIAVEQMPELIGGLQQLASDLQYPELARKAGLDGTVVVQVVVDKDGSPRDPEVVKAVAEILDKAAVAAVMKQKFKPGMQRNRAVAVRIAIPVKFELR